MYHRIKLRIEADFEENSFVRSFVFLLISGKYVISLA